MRRPAVLMLICAIPLAAQPPETRELLEALARSAAIFGRTFPAITARETLVQKGRRGDLEVLKRGRHQEIREAVFSIPPDFQTHEVVSAYSLASSGDPPAFHEVRRTLTVDSVPAGDTGPARHTMTLDIRDPDDETKKDLLEELEQGQLQGAAVDFGPMLLLFKAARQGEYSFKASGRRTLDSESVFVVKYRQVSGDAGLTDFRERGVTRRPFEGEIWLRESDLVPSRITLETEELLSPKYALRNEAEIRYQASPFGLVPASVVHRQYLNQDLLVENQFRYSEYNGKTFIP